MGKWTNLTTSVDSGSKIIHCLFDSFGQHSTSRSVSVIIGRNRFGMVPFSLQPIPDKTVRMPFVPILASIYKPQLPLDIILYFTLFYVLNT